MLWRRADVGWSASDATRLGGDDMLLAGKHRSTPFVLELTERTDLQLPTGLMQPLLVVPIGNPRRRFAVALYGGHETGADLDRIERTLLEELARDAVIAYAQVDSETLRRRVAAPG